MRLRKIGLGLMMMAVSASAVAEHLVILHTNDTHSQIEPDKNGLGGILQRKAVIDSVRKAEDNVILVDAGDVVQGSLYFKFFRGDVEYPLLNMMDYDIRILGNHEFDNGLDELAKYYKDVKGSRLSANYDFSATPLAGMFDPYVIKEVDGKKIGFIGINVDPESLIQKSNYQGMVFKNIIKTANETAAYLKNKKKCDLVVVVSHIGYKKESDKTTDVELAQASKDIDIIIGGHSHTLLGPDDPKHQPYIVENSKGKPVLITQTGKYGKYIGKIDIDLDKIKGGKSNSIEYTLIPVTDRFPKEQLDAGMMEYLAPYKHKVDSVNSRVIAQSLYDLNGDDRNGGYANFVADIALAYGRHAADSLRTVGMEIPPVDMGFMNVGGIRQNMPKGDVTEGEILSTFPFVNHMVLLEVKGQDIIDALQVALGKGGEAVSENVRVLYDDGNVVRVIINGEVMDPQKPYVVSTLDYVAEGNDDMRSWANGKLLWTDSGEVVSHVMDYIVRLNELGLPIAPDCTGRFQQLVK
ncbi:MAG: bifunctional metallophosphatase/5'-nucleotidase [Prevotella sp.]|nr:bifunctional metallophosphatase/5'-nucleotidase [Bacteroides sp.]MCM1366713.1 bifunctional metallophosphatase/5'-nucleotidase [Prevotella sp.]MCM1437273.1 bifunctional metallophosphatase/5'-nucleotidase [Prevotella sp.]